MHLSDAQLPEFAKDNAANGNQAVPVPETAPLMSSDGTCGSPAVRSSTPGQQLGLFADAMSSGLIK